MKMEELLNPKAAQRQMAAMEIAAALGTSKYEAMDVMAKAFGFINYTQFADWHARTLIDLSSVRGPHSLTILKMLVIQKGLKQP